MAEGARGIRFYTLKNYRLAMSSLFFLSPHQQMDIPSHGMTGFAFESNAGKQGFIHQPENFELRDSKSRTSQFSFHRGNADAPLAKDRFLVFCLKFVLP